MTSYTTQYILAIVVAVALVMIGFAIGSSSALGLSQQQVAILGMVSAGLGVVASVLPRVQATPSDERKGLD